MTQQEQKVEDQTNWLLKSSEQQKRKNRILLGIFVGAVIGFVILVVNRPQMKNSQILGEIGFPPTPKDLYKLSKILIEYKDQHQVYSSILFVYLYTLLQAFAIPGPIFLCVLAPTLYGAVGGYCLALSCSCLGASLCYFLSYSLAKSLVLRKFPALFCKFNKMVNANRQNLLWYMLFLRLTPLVPNWFVNLASPLVGMPYFYFLVATFFGIMPNNFILIQTGLTLKDINKIGMSYQHILILLFLGFLSLIPTFVSNYLKKKEEFEAVRTQQ